MPSPVRLLLACALILLALPALAACGGEEEDVQERLDKAFQRPIESADMKLDVQLQLRGGAQGGRPVRVQASGPFRTNKGKLPSANLELSFSAGGGGQVIQSGFVSTGDRVFLKFQDVFYEQPREQVAQTNRQLARNEDRRRPLGLDFRSWLKDASVEGEEKVGGTDTEHVAGRLDVRRLLEDLNELLRKQGSAFSRSTGQDPPSPLSKQDIDKATEIVKDPSFDVYIGKDDDVVRRVAGRLDAQVPEGDRQGLGGIQGGSLEFTIEFSDVGGDQRIEAPRNARPLSDLTRSLGAGALGGGLGGGAGGGGSGGGGGAPPAPGTPPSGGSTGPESEAFQRYAECLERARPEDRAALQRCAELLR